MVCYICRERTFLSITWTTFIRMNTQQHICARCADQLRKITNATCKKCFREMKQKAHYCTDCIRWENYYNGKDPLEKNVSIYHYNEMMQNIISQWKYRGDYMLGDLFRKEIQKAFQQHFRPLKRQLEIIPIPLSTQREFERGFNQAFQIASFITKDIKVSLQRQETEKQAKKSRKERIRTINPFDMQGKVTKDVLLIDDIYTTGTTLRHAAKTLKDYGCQKVYALTLIRG